MKKLDKKYIFLLFAFYGLIIIISSFSLSYWETKKNLHEHFIISSTAQLHDEKLIIRNWLEHYEKELHVLATSDLMQDFIKQKAHAQKMVTKYLLDRAKAHENFMQLRYLNNEGDEVIRIERKDLLSQPLITPKTKLQNKKNRYYFDEIRKLPANKICFSDIDLNVEHGKVDVPHVPTLRIGIPIFIDNKREGMLILNIFMYELLKNLELEENYKLYFIDSQGHFLIHPDPAYSWSKYLNKALTLKDVFPDQSKEILLQSNYSSDNLFTQEIFLGSQKRYILIAELNKETLNQKNDEVIENFLYIAFFILIFTFPFAYFIVRHIDALDMRLNAVVNNLGEGVIVLDEKEHIVYTNPKASELLEYSAKELLGHELHDKIRHAYANGEMIPREHCPIHNVKHTHKPAYNDQHLFTTKSGRHINIEYTVTPLIIAHKYQGSITAFRDISSRRILENDLFDVTEKFRNERNLFIQGPVVAFTWVNNATWPVSYVSSNVSEIFGYDTTEFTSGIIPYSGCIHPDDIAHVAQEVEQAIHENKKNFTHKPYRIITKSGSIRWLSDRTILVKNPSGKVTHFHGFVLDITEQKILEDKLQKSEESYRLLVENAVTGIFKSKAIFDIFYANPSFLHILDFDTAEELYNIDTKDLFLSHKDVDAFEQTLTKNRHISNYKLSLKTSKGEIKHLLLNANTDAQQTDGMIIDMTATVKAQDEIRRLSTVLEQIDDLVTITDVQGTIIYANEAFCRFTGYSIDEVLGKTPRVYKSAKHSKEEIKELWDTILDKRVYRSVVINKKKDNTLFYEEKTITPLINDDGEITAFVSTGKDITDRIAMQQELERLAGTDHLTQLYNRLKFEELFEIELSRVARYKHTFSLIMFDIDHFKTINDTHGHDVGDSVLVQLSSLVKNKVRSSDIVARWGGEEFMILSPESNIDTAYELAEKLRLSIEAFEFTTVKKITCSFGVTQLREEENFSTMAKRVDVRLYKAKQSGRNCVIKS